MACFIVSLIIMSVHDVDEKYLPDLDNDKSSEQIVFDQKVFRANEVFIKIHQDIINWYLSPPDKRSYPKGSLRNKMVSE